MIRIIAWRLYQSLRLHILIMGYDELTKVSSSVGTSIDYVYDALGRLSSQTETVDNKYLLVGLYL